MKYDIAISYKSALNQKASHIADYLMADGWKVFFAPIEQQELLSEKLHKKLYEIYKNESLLKILLIDDAYLMGEWTQLEKRVSLESTKHNRKRLLIVNYTGDVLPDELNSLVYLDGTKLHEDEIAAIATERLAKMQTQTQEREKDNIRKKASVVINNNHGIIAGGNVHFGDIHLK